MAYEWSHTKDESINFELAFTIKAFQAGIQMEGTGLDEDTEDFMRQYTTIRAGATLEVKRMISCAMKSPLWKLKYQNCLVS